MHKPINLILAASLCFASCSKSSITEEQSNGSISKNRANALFDAPYQAPNGANMLFKTEFDNTSVTTGTALVADITGTNITNYPWNATNYNFGNAFQIDYQGGDNTQRQAVVATEASNNILNFVIRAINDPTANPPKSRVQADIYGFKNPNDSNKPFKEFYQSVRMRLDYNSFHKIRLDHNRLIEPYGSSTTDSHDWLTLFEFWNNSNWDATNSGTSPGATVKYPFRISVNINKKGPYQTGTTPDQLYFDIHAQKSYSASNSNWEQDANNKNVYVWEESPNFTIPLGTWMTVEIYMKEGNASTGKFWMSVQPDGAPSKTIICNKTGITYSQYDPAPNGISDINPMKLYTSGTIVTSVKSTTNGPSRDLMVSWDSYKLYDKIPY